MLPRHTAHINYEEDMHQVRCLVCGFSEFEAHGMVKVYGEHWVHNTAECLSAVGLRYNPKSRNKAA